MKKSTIHFVGIGGIGLSALARYFLAQSFDKLPFEDLSGPSGPVEGRIDPEHRRMGQKWSISGSDVVLSPEIQELRQEGVEVKIGHKKGNIPPRAGLIIHSQAVSPRNPKLLEGKRRGIPVKSYPEVLGGLTLQYKTIAVAGSHGKSTTSS